MTNKQRDARQTAACDRLREMLQSIAILAVSAQDVIGNPDAVSDILDSIDGDMEKAREQVVILWDIEEVTP